MATRRYRPEQKLRTGAQLRAARAIAGIRQSDLAHAAGLHVNSIKDMERKDKLTSAPETLQRLELAIEGFGVMLTTDPAPGVREMVEHDNIEFRAEIVRAA